MKHFFFDLDGTISDSEAGVLGGVRHAINKAGRLMPAYEVLRRFIGPPLSYSFAALGMDAPKAVADYREYYSAKGVFENTAYEGIGELLAYCASVGRVYLATSKPEVYSEQIIESLGFT